MIACKWVVSSTDSYGQNNSFYVCCHLCRMHDKAKWRNRDRIKKKTHNDIDESEKKRRKKQNQQHWIVNRRKLTT